MDRGKRIISDNEGVSLSKKRKIQNYSEIRSSHGNAEPYPKLDRPPSSKTTTTKLVGEIFDNFFKNPIDNQTNGLTNNEPNTTLCGVCEFCQIPDCEQCYNCRNMVKFGGANTSNEKKTICEMRRCVELNNVIEEPKLLKYNNKNKRKQTVCPGNKQLNTGKVIWIGKAEQEREGRIYFSGAKIGNITVKRNDYIMVTESIKSKPLQVVKIMYMWQDLKGRQLFHANLFLRATATILGETADPNELFAIDSCADFSLSRIISHAKVYHKEVSPNWKNEGHQNRQLLQLDGASFYYYQKYDLKCGRFEQVTEVFNKQLANAGKTSDNQAYEDERTCEICRSKESITEEIQLRNDGIYFQNKVYNVGNGIYLEPYCYGYTSSESNKFDLNDSNSDNNEIDKNVYTEFYRKLGGNKNDTNVAKPFCIAMIEEIIYNQLPKETKLKVSHFCRPEHTHMSKLVTCEEDLNLVYWTNSVSFITIDEIRGQCYLACDQFLKVEPSEWTKKGPHRFYFKEGYDLIKKEVIPIPAYAREIGINKTTGLGSIFPEWKKLDKPMNCLDIFAGCGGFSKGLEQVGLSETKWAIENDPKTARAFHLNHPNTTVITKDCNEVLSSIMTNKDSEKELNWPQKGDVELIIGGPPCHQNFLIETFLSYCDFFKPNYFIFENVRNFVSFENGIVFKLTLRCMVAIGYQVAFGVLQSANYGVPQSRHRLIIIGAAPGYPLPYFPEPLTVYKKYQSTVNLNGIRCSNGIDWLTSAPFRTITVRDAISDLPKIKNGDLKVKKCYNSESLSHFQRSMRTNSSSNATVEDHICKNQASLPLARIRHIPIGSGADWRNLPNICVKLSDGLSTNKLIYKYRFKYQKKADPPRAVCRCALGQECDPQDRQMNTLIPWSLSHAADGQNNLHANYGRLDLDGVFGTTVTNPDPMRKQGKVLHPEQDRIISVRECARSQGFPDNYKFHGQILVKHRQIGNAVPPPLASAIGQAIINSIIDNQLSQI